ncbi:unnamed protein product [Leuciscus chuanchicus]
MVNSLFASQVGDSGTERSHVLAHLGLTGPICSAEKHNDSPKGQQLWRIVHCNWLFPVDTDCCWRQTEWAVFTYLRQSHEQAGSIEEKERTSIL